MFMIIREPHVATHHTKHFGAVGLECDDISRDTCCYLAIFFAIATEYRVFLLLQFAYTSGPDIGVLSCRLT